MPPGQQRVHDIGLAGAKIIEAEHVLQHAPLGISLFCRDGRRCPHYRASTVGVLIGMS